MLTSQSLAYLAGFLDGDGCISMVLHDKKTPYLHVNVGVVNGDVDATVPLLSQLPGAVSYSRARNVLQWQAYGPKGIAAVRLLRPFLVHKAEIADAVLNLYDTDRAQAYVRVKWLVAEMSRAPPSVDAHEGKMDMAPPPEVIAYAAGFFDAEGSVWIRGNQHTSIVLYVGFTQGDCRPLVWLADRFGGNVGRRVKRSSACGYTHAWFHTGRKAQDLLQVIQPYAKVKREEVDAVVAGWRAAGNPGGHDYLEKNRALRASRLCLQDELQRIKLKWKGGAARSTAAAATTVSAEESQEDREEHGEGA